MYVSWKLGSEFVSPAAAFPSRETCAWEHPSAYPKWKKRPQQETAREEREGNRSLVPQAGAMDLGERPGATDPDSEEIEEKSEAKPPTRFTEVLKLPPVYRGGPGEKPGMESSAGEAKESASEEPSTPAKAKPLEAPSTAERNSEGVWRKSWRRQWLMEQQWLWRRCMPPSARVSLSRVSRQRPRQRPCPSMEKEKRKERVKRK